jgi:hypothetical protein
MELDLPTNCGLSGLITVVFILAGTGSIMQIAGGNWDVTSHLLLKPETFFTPSHAILYTGIVVLIISAIMSMTLILRHKDLHQNPVYLPLKLLIVGSSLSLIAGPSDYLWHQLFGIDGFLSPTHLLLITGMLINSFGSAIGLVRIRSSNQNFFISHLSRIFLVIAFIALWLNIISFVYIFALPISNGELFNFNLNSIVESFIAIVFLPIVNSLVAILIIKTMKQFGYLTLIGSGIFISTLITNILPSEVTTEFMPYYLLSVLPFFIMDVLLYKRFPSAFFGFDQNSGLILAGSVSGSLFYIIGYPWLPLALGNYLMPIDLEAVGFTTLDDIVPLFMKSLYFVLPATVMIGALLGGFTAFLSLKFANRFIKKVHGIVK